jgi:hypothetical protein
MPSWVPRGPLPLSWSLLGAKPIGGNIFLPIDTPYEEVQRVQALFPETRVMVMKSNVLEPQRKGSKGSISKARP